MIICTFYTHHINERRKEHTYIDSEVVPNSIAINSRDGTMR